MYELEAYELHIHKKKKAFNARKVIKRNKKWESSNLSYIKKKK